MRAPLRESVVLLCEDEPVDAQRVRRCLRSDPTHRLALVHETTLGAGLERLAEHDIDAVLLDLNLPDSNGIDTVLRLRERDPAVPLVVFTGADDDETAVAALAAGAQDYLVKEEIGASLLCRSIRYAIERSRIAEENRRLERRLREVEKFESLGALSAGIGFGFNTQIGTILDHGSQALALLDALPGASGLRTRLLEIHRAAFRSAGMVQQLRDYATLECSASDEVDLARFVIDISGLIESLVEPEVHVACAEGREPLRVEIPRRELHRLLVSLVVNAAEAITGRGGSISISTGRLEADEKLLAEARGCAEPRPGPYAFLRVADTGCGLDAARCERIFDPFYSTKFAGRGLGLASVLGILQRHHSLVRTDPVRPTGTAFTVMFPLAEAPARLAH